MINDPAVWIAITSAVAAWLAVLFAYRSNKIAKRALALSEQQDRARAPDLVLYLIDGFVIIKEKDDPRIYAFSLSISNRSDNDNAIHRLELRISFRRRADHPSSNLFFQHDNTLADLPGAAPFSIPQDIGAHKTIAGWATFEVDGDKVLSSDIEEYDIYILDSYGVETRVKPIIVQEIEYETAVAQGRVNSLQSGKS